MTANWPGAITRARAHAPFLARGLDRQPVLEALLAAGDGEQAMAWAKAAGAAAESVASALRRERMALAVVLAVGDLAGAFPLGRVMGELSAFADRAMDAAIADAIRARMPDATPAGFLALALGKHGAQELNYSSDIDPILLYDPALLPRRSRDEPAEAAQRVARTLIETMSHVTAEGYVFRVDLRLRPASEVSPLAISIEAALSHYESSALAWERAAFIRARACAGDIAAGQVFLAAIRPFVWRKALDFGAITEIGRLTARIRANHGGPQVPGPGFDLKRGRGGIREVEFFAQTHQLIHGGRNPALRLRGTRASLDALATAGIIDPADAQLLGESYDRLRGIEHRLQMVGDQQTHSLPLDPAALDNAAWLAGLENGAALVAEVAAISEAVGQRYDLLIAEHSTAETAQIAVSGGEALGEMLSGLGFADPPALANRIAGWRSGRLRALRSDAARNAFDAIQPALLAAFAVAPEPERALLRWEQLLTNLPSAVNLFRLLEARPALLQLLARILSLAPPLADALTRRADLLDPLIDASAFDLPGEVAELAADFGRLEADDDYQRLTSGCRKLEIVTLEIKFGRDRKEDIVVYQGDDPRDLAFQFVEKHSLKASAMIAIQSALVRAISEFRNAASPSASSIDKTVSPNSKNEETKEEIFHNDIRLLTARKQKDPREDYRGQPPIELQHNGLPEVSQVEGFDDKRLILNEQITPSTRTVFPSKPLLHLSVYPHPISNQVEYSQKAVNICEEIISNLSTTGLSDGAASVKNAFHFTDDEPLLFAEENPGLSNIRSDRKSVV